MKRLPHALIALIGVMAFALSACTGSDAVNQTTGGDNFNFNSGTAIGKLYPTAKRKPAGDFDGQQLSGGTFKLAATKGKVVVINFWATWCGPCQTETPQFDLLYRQVKAKGVTFVGIDTKDDAGSAREFVRANRISYPIVYDEQGKTALRLGKIPQLALPFTVLIDKQGRVAAVYIHSLSDKDLQPPLDQLVAER